MSKTLPAFKHAPDGTAYGLAGPEGAPVLTLIHGLGLCSGVWEEFLEPLSKDHRVLVYDLYGHGQSRPARETLSLRAFSDQLAGLLAHLAIEKTSIIGFSIGGMINRRFALDHGEHLSSLVIMNSPHDRGSEGQELVEARAKKVREGGALATFDDALKRWFTPAFRSENPAVMARVKEWRLQADAESYAQAAWVLANGVRELINPVPMITAPSLVLTCENDSGSTPAMSHAIAKEISGAETLIVDELQHLGLMERAESFVKPIIEFLERQSK